MEEKDIFESEFDRQYGDSYREGNSAATNSDHQLPSNAAAPSEGTQSVTPAAGNEAAKELAKEVAPKDVDQAKYLVFGYDPADFVLTMYPNGPNCRHDAARDTYNDLLVMYDADVDLARNKLLSFQWVQDLITERGMSESDRIV